MLLFIVNQRPSAPPLEDDTPPKKMKAAQYMTSPLHKQVSMLQTLPIKEKLRIEGKAMKFFCPRFYKIGFTKMFSTNIRNPSLTFNSRLKINTEWTTGSRPFNSQIDKPGGPVFFYLGNLNL